MHWSGALHAAILAGIELAADLAVLPVVYLNPRSPADLVAPPRRFGAMRPVGSILSAHAVQWGGVVAVAALGLGPREPASLAAFCTAWLGGLAASALLLSRLLVARCGVDPSSARELVVAKLVLHGALWVFACVYATAMR